MRLAALLGMAGVMLALTGGSASAAGPLRLVEAAGAKFPSRSYVLTLPTPRQLVASQLRVTENGGQVQNLTLVSELAAAQPQFAAVLLIDASESMNGKPIAAAMAAARAFAAHRSPGQSLAVIAFNGEVRVLQPLTTDSGAISAALSQDPQLRYGTRIYDALDRAAGLLEGAHVASGSIVLISDGADVGSVAKPAAVLGRVRSDRVRVFSIGLVSPKFDRHSLVGAAAASGGSFVQTTKLAGLTPIFDRLGSRLSNQYLLGYHSLIGPGRHVAVQVAIQGVPGTAASGYTTPVLRIVPAPPYHPSTFDRVITSTVTEIFAALVIAGLFGFSALVIASRRPSRVLRRVGLFVPVALPRARRQREKQQASAARSAQLVTIAQRTIARDRWAGRLQATLDLADVPLTAAQLVLLTAIGTVLAMLLFSLIFGGWGIVLGLSVPWLARWLVLGKLARKRRLFAEQLPENLDVLASSLRAGHSLAGGLAVVVENTGEPSKSELQRALADERLGMPLEDALKVVVERMDSADLDQVALVARLQRDTGSNSAEVLDRVVETVRARMELRRLVRTLTAQGRFSRWVLTALPIALALALSVLHHGYLDPLVHHGFGRFLIVAAILMVASGSVIIGKIVNIKV